MKNLKKVLALVVVFAMMVSSVAFAAIYPDVAADADYANAVSVLSDLGMIKGDDKGNFNPDATITRAEFATMITRLLGVESAATGKANFADVAADHWATGYIAMAQQQGIISGYGDGNFGPENPVKYEEAVKMLVCALGYEQMAVSKGGWVAGYLTTAYQIGLLEDVSGTQGAGAPRSLVAQLCYNALDIPMMEQTGFGTDVKYEIMKKNDDHDKVTLLTKMGIYKLGGIVAANSKVRYNFEAVSTESPADKGFVDFWWDDDFDSPVSAWAKKTAKDPAFPTAASDYYAKEVLEIGETDIEDAIGNQLVVYVKKNVSKYEVLAYEIDASSTSMTIKASDLADEALLFAAAAPSFKYYKEEGAKATKVNLEAGYAVVWNNVSKNAAYLVSNLNSDASATIELIDYDDDNKYNIVKVTSYEHAIVKDVNVNRGLVTDMEENRINFDIENEDAVISITDINGNALELKDIAEGDVLAMVVNATGDAWTALRAASYTSLDVIVLKDSFVTGTVSGADTDGIGGEKDYFVIGDKEYTIANVAGYCYQYSKVKKNAEGKFWLAIDGETIIGFEGDLAKAGNYAVLLKAFWNSTRDTTDCLPTFEVVTKDGYKEMKIADRVKFIDENGEAYAIDADETNTTKLGELNTSLANTKWSTVFADTDAPGKNLYDAFNAGIEGTADASKAAVAQKNVVKIDVNANNEITAITPAVASNNEETEYNLRDLGEIVYDAADLKLGTKNLVEGAAVIEIDFTKAENTKFTDIGYFVDENKYSVLGLDVDENGDYAAAVVYKSSAVYAAGDSVAIVKSTLSSSDAEGDDLVVVKAVKDGKDIELTFYEEGSMVPDEIGSTTGSVDFEVGTVIMFAADSANVVSKYSVVGTYNWTNAKRPFTFNSAYKTYMQGLETTEFEDGDAFYYGYIVENSNKLQIALADTIESTTASKKAVLDDFEVTEDDVTAAIDVLTLSTKGANMYGIYGTKKSTAKIDVTDYRVNEVTEMYKSVNNTGVATDEYEVYYVLVRTYEGKVVDIISMDVAGETTTNIVKPFDGTPLTAPSVVAPVAPVVEEKAEVKEEIVELEGFDL